MIFRFPIFALLVFSLSASYAQTDCAGGRYVDYQHFDSVQVSYDVLFGNNIGVNGSPEDLFLDVYEPAMDANTNRPVVVVAFGGSFIGGDKEDVDFLCTILAKLGYVAVAPSYRIGLFTPSTYNTTLAVLRGTHDVKACLRYLHKSVDIGGNPWGIDTTRIIVGGISSGGISAIHAVYLDKQSEIPAVLYPDSAALGNVPGNSGNLGYSERVIAVWNMSGAIADTLYIEPGDEPLISLHEENDPIVPYATAQASVLGIPTGIVVSGSSVIHRYMDAIGLDNCFKSYPGNGHVEYLLNDSLGSVGFLVDFLGDMVCGQSPDCGSNVVSVQEQVQEELFVAPNPTTGLFNLNLDQAGTAILYDSHGRAVMQFAASSGVNTLDITELNAGYYVLQVTGQKQFRSARIIKTQ